VVLLVRVDFQPVGEVIVAGGTDLAGGAAAR